MDFTQNPAYQRMIQRLQRIRPEQRAVLNNLSVDAQFADAETRKMLASLTQKQNKDYANRSLALRDKEITSNLGLRRQAFDEGVRTNRMTTGLGVGQVAAETKFGLDRDKIEMETLKKKMDFMNRLEALYGGA